MKNNNLHLKKIDELISRELKFFPESTIIDFYKLFFQSAFGPAHIISDKCYAKTMLENELKKANSKIIIPFYDISFINKFYRVDIRLINRYIPFDIFFNAFLKSANLAKSISWEEWGNIWNNINSILAAFPIVRDEEEKIRLSFRNKEPIHHSEIYRKLYNPHYRIISKMEFEKILDNNKIPLKTTFV